MGNQVSPPASSTLCPPSSVLRPVLPFADAYQSGRRDSPRGEARDPRLVPRDNVRVVRLLPLRHPGPVLCRPLLPAGQRYRRAPFRLCHVRRWVSRPPIRGAGVWSGRRHRREEIHLPRHHRLHGGGHLRRGAASHLRNDRLVGSDLTGHAAADPGSRARRRVWRCRDLRGGARTRPPRSS
jgi:hypothetical protein